VTITAHELILGSSGHHWLRGTWAPARVVDDARKLACGISARTTTFSNRNPHCDDFLRESGFPMALNGIAAAVAGTWQFPKALSPVLSSGK